MTMWYFIAGGAAVGVIVALAGIAAALDKIATELYIRNNR